MVCKARENMSACKYMYFCIPLWLHRVLQFIGTPKKKNFCGLLKLGKKRKEKKKKKKAMINGVA